MEKQDSLLGKQDENLSEVKGLRDDLKSYMEERFERIEHEIAVIKEKIRRILKVALSSDGL